MKEKVTGWVSVFTSGDPGRIAVAKSLLEASGIRFFAQGDDAAPVLGAWNRSAALTELQVALRDRARAEEALGTLLQGR